MEFIDRETLAVVIDTMDRDADRGVGSASWFAKLRLRVLRRPAWTKSVSPAELDRKEKASFLDWRRGLAEWVF